MGLASTACILFPNIALTADLLVDGDGIFSGEINASAVKVNNSTVSGKATVAGPLMVAGSTELTTLTVSGALRATADTRINNLDVSGITNLASVKITGSTTLSGAFSATGTTTLNGARVTDTLNVTAPLNVLGNTTLAGALSVTGDASTSSMYVETETNTETLIVRSGANIAELSVTGRTQLQNTKVIGSLEAIGPTTLATVKIGDATVDKSFTVNGPLDVKGSTTFAGPVTVAGSTSLGSANISGLTDTFTLNVRDSASLANLSVSGTSALGSTSVGGNLNVTGRTRTEELLAGDIDTSNLRVSGTLTVEGLIDLPRKYSFGEITVEGQSTLSDTTVAGTFNATQGANALHLGEDGFKVVTGMNGGAIASSTTDASLQHAGSGIRTSQGTTEVSGSVRTTVTGGGTTLAFSSTGATLSGPKGIPARLSGIADGVDRNDAVNVGQLQSGLDRASYGIAMGMAMAQLPAPREGSNYSIGVALGSFGGMDALAVGGSALLGETAILRASVSKAGGTVGGGVGIGWSF